MSDLLVRGGELLRDGRLERADVLIRRGAIAAIGAVEAQGVPELDAAATIVIPGLVNAHMHSGENYNPGLYENLPLDLWFLHSHQVTRTEPPAPDVIYVRTLLGALLMALSGTTVAVDFLYEAPEITSETLEPVVRAYRDVGLRATILLGVADKPFLDSLPLDPAERAAAAAAELEPSPLGRIVELVETAVARFHEPGGLVQIGLGPSAPQRCSEELLEATMRLAEEHDLVWHTHALETKTQRYTALERHGHSFVAELDARGFLGPRSTLVHAVWLSDRDIELLAGTGTTMIHCLCSNLRLGDGVARLSELRDAGVRIALGTDGRGCDETLDMVELMKTTATVHKVRGEPLERWPTATQVFRMATEAASLCTGHGERLGRLEPGARGDLVLLDRRSLTFTPLNDPLRQLVYGVASRDVRAVVVAGRVVVRDGQVPGVDLDSLRERAERYAQAEAPARKAPDLRLQRIVLGLYERAEHADVGVDAYLTRPRGGASARA